jgi:transposase
MYLIGIDISKYKHDCFIATEVGEIIQDVFTFKNNHLGFKEFHDVLKKLDPSQSKRIGLEATGHYGHNLKAFLDREGYSFMEFNPYLVSKFAKSLTLRKTKTDKVDSRFLSMILLSIDYKVYPVKSYHIQEIKSLTRYYKRLVKRRSKELVNLTNILDYVFPEFKPFFNGKFSKTAFYILKTYHTKDRISRLNKQSFENINKISRGHFSFAKFTKLKELAKTSIGSNSSILTFEQASIIRLHDSIYDELKIIEKELINQASLIDSPVFFVRGIGTLSALSIITEYDNFTTFDSPGKMLSFAGLEPSIIQSGTIEKQGKMVKRGSGYLRETIMNVSTSFMMHNPAAYSYYHKKRQEGKSHRVALTHVAKKLIRVIFYLVKHNEQFDSNQLR